MDTMQKLSDSLSKVGDVFNALTATVERGITGMFGSSNERRVRAIGFARDKHGISSVVPGSLIDQINQLEAPYEKLTDDELRQTSSKLRARLAAGETLDDVLPDAFAAVRESSKRVLKMRHYDVQMVGGVVLHRGMIAEMTTGEGKTLVATLPAYLNALAGKVHVITVNDYLALRDMEWMGPVHMALGLTIGAIQAHMPPHERKIAYACDITYGTNNEFGFDYLRDNMKPTQELQVQGKLDFALVDEIDNILIDEARTPLIISGPAHDDLTKYTKANLVAIKLQAGVHFEVKEKEHTCHLTDEGIRHAENLAGVESFYTAGNMHWPHLIDNSLKAHHLYRRDVNYVVENGDIIIIDEHTGRKMVGRQWSDGLHQAVEAKEGVRIKEESQTLATITLQNYFKLYHKLAGMTGTAMTEADEFLKIYKLDVISVPTNRPMQRINHPDVIFRSEREKWDAVAKEIREVHDTGRPVLVGTVSIEKSEKLSGILKRYGIQHSLLNAKFHEREAEIIAQAGRKGAVTISTNMAGRGTDIVLGGNPEHLAWDFLSKHYATRLDVPKSVWDEKTREIAKAEGMEEEGDEVAALGGLHVIGTERHDSRRIDLQLRGRAGRQGDPGSSRFFLSLDDDLLRIFMGEWVRNLLTTLGMEEGEAIESRMVSRRIEAAQKKVEERHFESRKNLLEYDEVMDKQRKEVYSSRQRILEGGDCRRMVLDMIDQQVVNMTNRFLAPVYRWETVTQWCAQVIQVNLEPHQIRDMETPLLLAYIRDEAKYQADEEVEEALEENLPEDDDQSDWNWQALSHWANSKFGLNTNVSELQKVGRESLHQYLFQRGSESIDRYDLSPVETFVRDDWGAVSLVGWLERQFTLQMDPTDLDGLEPDDAVELINKRVRKMYYDKEVQFPVSVGILRFTIEDGGGRRLDREGLAKWARNRFKMELEPEDVKATAEFQQRFLEGSERWLSKGAAISDLESRIETTWGKLPEDSDSDVDRSGPPSMNHLPSFVSWANEQFGADLSVDDLAKATRDDAEMLVRQAYDKRFRPEMRQAERAVFLELLDTNWKDHLYHMGHVRSGVGLMGYAQKDPKVEYKREGLRAFDEMNERIGQQVTSTIFRLEYESPDFVGNLWDISGVIHEDAGSVADLYDAGPAPSLPPQSGGAQRQESSGGGSEPGQSVKVVDPIRNYGEKVGRNDPCPCGSGKKYKKCCGAT